MMTLRASDERGHTKIDWLDSYHTFSFGDYMDSYHMGFSDLRVINDDIVKPGKGFSTHGHRDMEIVTIVLSGELEHRDSMGNGSAIRPGDVQRMSAGTGVTHSEFNPSSEDPVHLLQIWILPERNGLTPSYAQKNFSSEAMAGQWRLLVSPDGREESVTIHQDAQIYETLLNQEERINLSLASNRSYWLHVATGTIQVDHQLLEAGDGLAIRNEDQVASLTGVEDGSQVILFNLRRAS